MSSATGAWSVTGLKRRLHGARRAGAWRPSWSRAAALRAARTTVVMPGTFALAYEGFGNLQMALFAGFGSFATLVLATFAGTWRDKLRAHIGLALAGSALILIGTTVSSSTALAALVTVPVTFLVFFAGIAGPNAATGGTAALLAYVLPAASPGTLAIVPDRLAGWWLASIAGTVAVLAVRTPATGDRVRAAVAKLVFALADELEAMVRGEAGEALLQACKDAKLALLTEFTATPFRPTGLSIRDQALASEVDVLEWCTTLVVDSARERSDLHDAPPVERELLCAAGAVLRQSGELFEGGTRRPAIAALEERRRESLDWVQAQAVQTGGFGSDARLSFHAHTITMAVLGIGADALVAAELAGPESVSAARSRWVEAEIVPTGRRLGAVSSYSSAAARHTTLRSVWFVNSLRGALALAVAVAVADLSSLQHGFWVVLGTLSVLRTNASATGATALRALLGTVVGFVIGGALLLAIGTSNAALWIVLPFAVLIASYSPGTAPFAVGQAAFTVTVAVLFNLLVPVGWKVGEVRVEDVALGCAVSLIVGLLFWPRGVSSLVGDDLADAYRAGATYLREAVQWVCGSRSGRPNGARAAFSTAQRLDAAVRAFLAEQGTKHLAREDLWRLIGGTRRVRLTAHAIAELPRDCARTGAAERSAITERVDDLARWYDDLAAQLGRPEARIAVAVTPSPLRAWSPAEALTSGEAIWLSEHLDQLAEHLTGLVEPAGRVAETRRRPWWQ